MYEYLVSVGVVIYFVDVNYCSVVNRVSQSIINLHSNYLKTSKLSSEGHSTN